MYGTTGAYEVIPPLFIFDSKAKQVENQKIKTEWVEGLPRVRGRYGCPTTEEYCCHVAVRPSGSMDDVLFMDYIQKVILLLYPNIGKTLVRDENGVLVTGPILIKTDGGPGRLRATFESIDFREKLGKMGAHILLSSPNGTSVGAEMDQLYRVFKASCRLSTDTVYSEKVFRRMRLIEEREQHPEANIVVPTVVNLTPSDLPAI